MDKAIQGKRGLWRWAVFVLSLVLVAGAVWGYRRTQPYAEIGATYLAKQVCSCVFVTGRTEASCRAEFKPDIDRFSVTIDRKAGRVSTRLAVFSGAATYADGFGCTVAK